MDSKKLIFSITMNTIIRRSENEKEKLKPFYLVKKTIIIKSRCLKYGYILYIFDVLPKRMYQDMMDLYSKSFGIYRKHIHHKIYVSNELSIF